MGYRVVQSLAAEESVFGWGLCVCMCVRCVCVRVCRDTVIFTRNAKLFFPLFFFVAFVSFT